MESFPKPAVQQLESPGGTGGTWTRMGDGTRRGGVEPHCSLTRWKLFQAAISDTRRLAQKAGAERSWWDQYETSEDTRARTIVLFSPAITLPAPLKVIILNPRSLSAPGVGHSLSYHLEARS